MYNVETLFIFVESRRSVGATDNDTDDCLVLKRSFVLKLRLLAKVILCVDGFEVGILLCGKGFGRYFNTGVLGRSLIGPVRAEGFHRTKDSRRV